MIAGSKKRKLLGQHMLVDTKILHRIVQAAGVSESEIVCEVGTGRGILTAELCKRAKKVISFEIDRELYKNAQSTLASFSNVEIINADLFRADKIEFDVFASNLPYSRSRDAVKWLARQKFDRAFIMVQQEFAYKLTALPGGENYRAISVLAQTCFDIEKLFHVGKKSFEPQPLVESAVLKLSPKKQATGRLVRNLDLLFSHRNKKAASVAAKFGDVPKNTDFEDKRIYQLTPDEIVSVCDSMR